MCIGRWEVSCLFVEMARVVGVVCLLPVVRRGRLGRVGRQVWWLCWRRVRDRYGLSLRADNIAKPVEREPSEDNSSGSLFAFFFASVVDGM